MVAVRIEKKDKNKNSKLEGGFDLRERMLPSQGEGSHPNCFARDRADGMEKVRECNVEERESVTFRITSKEVAPTDMAQTNAAYLAMLG
ncbi:hypothetical protein FH972_020685 [Carpinus fangiana]|uniref:Uncharacterized protein n=1 Tax=Carpinus fangiana TaxID=176857 RepID=A0A5N6RYE0_9ROSI|nr:hypothetical protein FH972_020685 [Carpinus fangiana]